MAELTLEESIRQILPTLPLPIQKFFEQRKLGETARLLMERYALHIDQGTVLERELMLLLFGLESPDQFAEELYANLPVSQQTVQDIMTDINKEVFIPLREEMRKGDGKTESAAPASPKATQGTAREVVLPPRTTIIPANPQMPARPAQALTSVPRYVPPKKYFNLQNKIPPPVQPQPLRGETPKLKLLEDHEEPSPSLKATEGTAHIEFRKAPSPTTESPLRQALRTVMPRPFEASGVVGPTVNLPGATPPPTSAIPKPPIVTTSPPPPPPAKPYSSDPYHEPIDEK